MDPVFFSEVPSARTRGTGNKLENRRFHLSMGQHICAVWVMELWHRDPEAVGSPPGDVQKPPGRGPGHPAWGVSAGAGDGLCGSGGPCEPQLFFGSVN